uniref:Uncharacterized protein n=1 Tax=Anolis carolinensis TaxID=28377 RepID=A0A803TLE1_ANOCA
LKKMLKFLECTIMHKKARGRQEQLRLRIYLVSIRHHSTVLGIHIMCKKARGRQEQFAPPPHFLCIIGTFQEVLGGLMAANMLFLHTHTHTPVFKGFWEEVGCLLVQLKGSRRASGHLP